MKVISNWTSVSRVETVLSAHLKFDSGEYKLFYPSGKELLKSTYESCGYHISAFISLKLNLWYISALKIQCSTPMYDELKKNMAHAFVLQKRGEIDVKGKGRQVTYWLLRKDGGTPRQRRLQHSARSVILSCRHFVIAVVLAFILPRLLKDCVPAGVHNNKLQAR